MGDAAASLVGPQIYEEFVLPYEQKLVDGLHAMGAKVRLHICGNTRRILGGMGTLGCEIVDIDFMVPLEQARREMGPASGVGRQYSPGRLVRNGTPEVLDGRAGRVPAAGRAAVHPGRRLRGAPRHARGQCPGLAGLRPGTSGRCDDLPVRNGFTTEARRSRKTGEKGRK